jgi:hypothetical protein
MTSEITMQTRKADGLAIRYAETDAPDEPTLRLLSPWPESIYAREDKADAYGDAALAWLEGGFARVGGDA